MAKKKIRENCYLFIDSMNFSKTFRSKFGGQKKIDFDFDKLCNFFLQHRLKISKVFVYSVNSESIPKTYKKKSPDNLSLTEYVNKKRKVDNFQFSIEKKGCILRHEHTILKWNTDKVDWEEKGVDALLIVDAIRLNQEYKNMILCSHDGDYRPMMYYITNELCKYTVLCTVNSGIHLNEERYRNKCIKIDENFPTL